MAHVIFTIVLIFTFAFDFYAQKSGNSYRLFINEINLPLERTGIIAAVDISHPDPFISGPGGKFDGHTFLFSSGFMLSGYSSGNLWANGMASASLIIDYLQGTIADGAADPRAQMYVIKKSDQPFGQSWQDWKDAVALGADFYDGDGDGIYNPVDLNGNGVWDPDEDAPDMIGDEMVWCVFNDGVPAIQRRWNQVQPLGIEIRQTAFAYSSHASLSNIIFFRYRIKYKGLNLPGEPDKLEDVYFGLWADPDIGDHVDDLVGSDVSRNAVYTYNDGADLEYGSNPPSYLTNFLSGPMEYIPGITFIDLNGNGIYDEGIDTPLDTAYSMRGPLMGITLFPGARNQKLSSGIGYLKSIPPYSDPSNHIQARNFMLGLLSDGSQVDPCTFILGEVRGGVDCNSVNPLFWFSGDPVTNTGWIAIQDWDVRQLANAGPFTLYKDTEQNYQLGLPLEKEIIAAYVVGRGDDPLTSINAAKNIADKAINLINVNFDQSLLSVKEIISEVIPEGYTLTQNYPNPFNPSTKINFSIPASASVTLKIYDVLGNEIAVLINEEMQTGIYEVEFNAAANKVFSSGIYFYKLTAGSFSKTKKMVMVK
jgi:hypothetical protein